MGTPAHDPRVEEAVVPTSGSPVVEATGATVLAWVVQLGYPNDAIAVRQSSPDEA